MSNITMHFSNKLVAGSSIIDYTQLFDDAIEAGRDNTINKLDMLSFRGTNAHNVISEFISSALDMSKKI